MPDPRRILIYTPIHRLETETVDAILSLDPGPHSIAWLCDRDHPAGDDRQRILDKYAHARDLVVGGDYTDLMIVESDIIPPPDALVKLAEHTAGDAEPDRPGRPGTRGAGVAHGLYFFRRGWNTDPMVNAARWVRDPRGPDQPLNLFEGELEAAWRKTVRITGNGLGCVMIRRDVLERVPFAHNPSCHCDTQFSVDCCREGVRMVCDLSIHCGHKRPDGMIIQPVDPAGYELIPGEPETRFHNVEAMDELIAARAPDARPDTQTPPVPAGLSATK